MSDLISFVTPENRSRIVELVIEPAIFQKLVSSSADVETFVDTFPGHREFAAERVLKPHFFKHLADTDFCNIETFVRCLPEYNEPIYRLVFSRDRSAHLDWRALAGMEDYQRLFPEHAVV